MDTKVMNMDDFQKLLSDMFDTKIRELGLDKVDRKHGIFPSKDDPNGDDLQGLTKEERVAKFVRAIIDNDHVTAKALSEGTSADGGYLYLSYSGLKLHSSEKRIRWVYTETKSCKLVLVRYSSQ